MSPQGALVWPLPPPNMARPGWWWLKPGCPWTGTTWWLAPQILDLAALGQGRPWILGFFSPGPGRRQSSGLAARGPAAIGWRQRPRRPTTLLDLGCSDQQATCWFLLLWSIYTNKDSTRKGRAPVNNNINMRNVMGFLPQTQIPVREESRACPCVATGWRGSGWRERGARRTSAECIFSRLWSTFFKSPVTNSKNFWSKSTHDVFRLTSIRRCRLDRQYPIKKRPTSSKNQV